MTSYNLKVQFFKCFKNNSFELTGLTLLAGENASGKTSLLQVLALLHQAASEAYFGDGLPLNGQTVSLGMCEDVINKQFGRDQVIISISSDSWEYSCKYTAPDKQATDLKFIDGSWKENEGKRRELESPFHWKKMDYTEPWIAFLTTLQSLTYLSADRSGPKEVHLIEGARQYNNVGPKGERTAWFLNKYKDNDVIEALRKPGVSPWLIRQVEARMQDFFPGFQLELVPIKRTNHATLGMLTDSSTGYLRPQNIGFGLSYSLPIFTACLGAKLDDIVLIENPEAHLHPRGQSQMGEFLAEVACAGVRVIIETHSDHILNGIRKAVKHKTLTGSEVTLYFFNSSSKKEVPQVISPSMDNSGNLSEWPRGFFDQFDKDLETITEWGERV